MVTDLSHQSRRALPRDWLASNVSPRRLTLSRCFCLRYISAALDFPTKYRAARFCGEEELVRGVHTLVARVVQVYHRLHVVEEEERLRKVEQEVEKGGSRCRDRTHMEGHGDEMKNSNLSQSACVCEDEDTTTYLRECARCSVDVVAGVRIVQCHAIIDVAIDVRVMHCHKSRRQFWIFHFSEFFTSCSNSHLVIKLYQFVITFPCSYFVHTFCLHRGKLSFEVWYLQ